MADEVEPEQHDREQRDPQRPPPGEGHEQEREGPLDPDTASGNRVVPSGSTTRKVGGMPPATSGWPGIATLLSAPAPAMYAVRDSKYSWLERGPVAAGNGAGEPSTRMSAVSASPVKNPIAVRACRCRELPRASGTTASLRRAQDRSMTSGPEYAVAGRLRWIESVPEDEAGIVSGRLLPVTAKPGIDVLALSMVQLAVVL